MVEYTRSFSSIDEVHKYREAAIGYLKGRSNVNKVEVVSAVGMRKDHTFHGGGIEITMCNGMSFRLPVSNSPSSDFSHFLSKGLRKHFGIVKWRRILTEICKKEKRVFPFHLGVPLPTEAIDYIWDTFIMERTVEYVPCAK